MKDRKKGISESNNSECEDDDIYEISMTICNFLGYSSWKEWMREYCLNDKNRCNFKYNKS